MLETIRKLNQNIQSSQEEIKKLLEPLEEINEIAFKMGFVFSEKFEHLCENLIGEVLYQFGPIRIGSAKQPMLFYQISDCEIRYSRANSKSDYGYIGLFDCIADAKNTKIALAVLEIMPKTLTNFENYLKRNSSHFQETLEQTKTELKKLL